MVLFHKPKSYFNYSRNGDVFPGKCVIGYAEAEVRLVRRSDGDLFSALWGPLLRVLLQDWHR